MDSVLGDLNDANRIEVAMVPFLCVCECVGRNQSESQLASLSSRYYMIDGIDNNRQGHTIAVRAPSIPADRNRCTISAL